MSGRRPCSAATVVPLICRRFAQLCEIGPRDFFCSLYVDSTTQGDFGHVVRSSVGCLGSEIFWVMCLNLHIPDNAEKHCFEHKSQFLILKYWDSAFPPTSFRKSVSSGFRRAKNIHQRTTIAAYRSIWVLFVVSCTVIWCFLKHFLFKLQVATCIRLNAVYTVPIHTIAFESGVLRWRTRRIWRKYRWKWHIRKSRKSQKITKNTQIDL